MSSASEELFTDEYPLAQETSSDDYEDVEKEMNMDILFSSKGKKRLGASLKSQMPKFQVSAF